MKRVLLVPAFVAVTVTAASSQQPAPSVDALIARAKSLELDTPYEPPPGDALEHHTSGFAKIMCSAVFITVLLRGSRLKTLDISQALLRSARRSARRR